MERINIAEVLDKAVPAVRAAGQIIKEAWDKPKAVQRKGRIDLITETDPAVEDALMVSLADLAPGARFLAEESTGAGQQDLSGHVWVIDPLDGTTNFVHTLPFVAVSVALCQDGRPVVGLVYNPVMDELFTAGHGLGATFNGKPMRASGTETLQDSVIATGFPYTIARDVDELLGYLKRLLPACQGIRRYGVASLDLAYTALGRLDGFYEIGLKPWDTAAGWLLLEEAGGQVTSFDLSAYHLYSRGILASNGLVHREMAGLLGFL